METRNQTTTQNGRAQIPAAPSISLAKGGGAIRGLGEKFAANPVTGTGSLTVPIGVSPGRSGFGPQLSLTYDSGAGNGPFGMGCSLPMPVITRKTEKGLPQYRDADESDIFILSGVEDLVPILVRDDECRLEFDEFERDGYSVKRYRPRIEGLFARIERWTRIDDGDIHWRSISRENILTIYGIDARSRIADPENPTHVFSWLICRSYDDKGNAVLYDYAAENGDGVDHTAPNERHRFRSANRYPKRIRYGNREPLLLDCESRSFRRSHLEPHDLEGTQWMFEVVFDYGEGHYLEESPEENGRSTANVSLTPTCHWPVRNDPFSSYRSGFEIRTYRLCRRVLMFHHFAEELGTDSYLVSSTSFEYHEKPIGSFISRVIQSGHRLLEEDRYFTRSLPPLELSYTVSPLEDPDFEDFRLYDVNEESLANLPGGIDGGTYRWLDLDGEGISGVLTEEDEAWFYKPNLGSGRFGATERVKVKPAIAALSGGAQLLMDVAGDGNLDLVDLSPFTAGFHERTSDASWEGFQSFQSLPVRDWSDPNLRFVDLTGDGVADVLVTEENALIWHPSLLKQGFGEGRRVRIPTEEETGPRVLFADGTESIYLADMSGDGLSDLVRIRNGEICYWPNRGYGRFGAKITMNNAPRFDKPGLFDQSRVRLADTDGSGTSDILYLGLDGVRVYLNQTGNGWSHSRHIRVLPAIDNVGSIIVSDFLGRGTACLLWSSPRPRETGRQLRYVDLMCGQKPHLLVRTTNNLGAETRLEYATSTEYYLADKAAGTPWVTKLPFPVHVVKRVETFDEVSRNRFVTRYTYHHGFYDGVEREFRGFGRVDQLDTEEFAAISASHNFPIGDNIDAASHVPPVLTKTWFHTGVYLRGESISRHAEHEYYREGAMGSGEGRLSRDQLQAMQLDDTRLPDHLTSDEAREACRSLRGSMLRQEVYALDNQEESSRPYTVSENNYTIRSVQPQGRNRYAVFFVHARESLSFQYERKLYQIENCRRADPRVSHSVTLDVDDHGNVLKSVSIGYGRRFGDPSALLTEEDRKKQSRILLTMTESTYTNAVDEGAAWRTPLLAESRQYELVNVTPSACLPATTNLFRFHELAKKVARMGDGLHDLPLEDWKGAGALDGSPARRLRKQSRSLYRSNQLDCVLPLAKLESLALLGENYQLSFTPGLLSTVYRKKIVDQPAEELLPDIIGLLGSHGPCGGGYVDLDGDGRWWTSGDKVYFHPDLNANPMHERDTATRHFFLFRRYQDAFGNSTMVDFDAYDLVTIRTVDAVGNTVSASIDYRVLQPNLSVDPNGNRSEVAYDTLGFVAGTAVMGKVTESLGDSLEEFRTDLSQAEIDQFFHDPKGSPAATLLGRASSRIVYDTDRYYRSRKSNPDDPKNWHLAFAATLGRETHESDLAPGQQTEIQVGFSYSDGFGREIQKKAQAESGTIVEGGKYVARRWIASGWTIFNNKGKPVRQYEPFFDDTHDFKFGIKVGVSPTLIYDPVERVIATINPNHTWQKVVFDPWQQATWDNNDTVLMLDPTDSTMSIDPRHDEDVGQYFRRLPIDVFLPTWYESRINGSLGSEEQRSARQTAIHASTPSVTYLDSISRKFLNLAHNRFQTSKQGAVPKEEFQTSRVEFDASGQPRQVIDALGRIAMSYDYDILGRVVRQDSIDAGQRLMLADATDNPIFTRDDRGHELRMSYDSLRRIVDVKLEQDGILGRITTEKRSYGESTETPEVRNARGRLVEVCDQGGIQIMPQFDFKGNVVRSVRKFSVEYKSILDWSTSAVTETEAFTSATTYDGLNRPEMLTMPDHSRIHLRYNEANLLSTVTGNLAGADPEVVTTFVSNIDHDAKGQRTRIDYGNGTATTYEYDPRTYRLTRLVTHRDTTDFPDDDSQPPPAGFPGRFIQNVNFTYDPVGNITSIRDDAQQTIFFRNQKVDPSSEFLFDSLYRLIEATGREHLGLTGSLPSLPTAADAWDAFHTDLDHPSDGKAVGRYLERFIYDMVGNFQEIRHQSTDPSHGNWSRTYETSPLTNRLVSTLVSGGLKEEYACDEHGNTTQMPHLHGLTYDYRDQMRSSTKGIGLGAQTTYYVYDSAGQRVRKVTDNSSGMRQEERCYIDGYEIYRQYENDGTTVSLERTTVPIMDDDAVIAIIEHRTIGDDGTAEQLVRYQHGNHLGTVTLELNDQGQIITYEEYSAYGSTVYQAVNSSIKAAAKRYRYTGKERDEENGFTYHGARYYAPWLGRWTTSDPAGLADGVNGYVYGRDNPIRLKDPNGTLSAEEEGARRNAARADRGELTPDQIGDVYKSVDDVPKNLEPPPNQSPERVEEQQNRLAQGESKRAQDKKDQAKIPKLTLEQKKEKRTQAANAGAQNAAVETLESLANLSKFGPLAPLTLLAPSPSFDSLKAEKPASTGDRLQDSILDDYYDTGEAFTNTAIIATSFVPVGEIAQGAKLAAGKLPTPIMSLGNVGGMEFISASEKWAASTPKTYITYVFTDSPGSIRYVGRASGTGTPEEVLYKRLTKGHHVFDANPDLVAEVLAEHPTAEASKGAESVYHDYFKEKGHNLLNDPKTPPLSGMKGKLPKTRNRIQAFFDSW